MKKSIIRGSMLAVAVMSLMLGGTSYTPSIKSQVSETPAIVGKAIANSKAEVAELTKGTALFDEAQVLAANDTAEDTDTEGFSSEQVETSTMTELRAEVDDNQVVACIDGYLNIRSAPNEDGEVTGKFYNGNVGTIIEHGDEWSVVASGNAYGYVKNDYLLFGEDAEAYIENNCDQVARVTAETLNIREEDSVESDIVALIDQGAALTLLGQSNGWVQVADKDGQVGYVSNEYVCLDYVYETAVTVEEERAAQEQWEAELEAAENNSNNNNNTPSTEAPSTQAPTTEAPSTQAPTTEAPTTEAPATTEAPTTEAPTTETPTSGSTLGQQIANFACQFVGNPYVWGGTSLTNGADCSGFVMSVYAHFGISLPRVAADQANAGTSVSVDNLQPGDLLFYHGFGHVAIYIGNGQVVHASNRATGIKISNYNYSPINKAVRIVW